MSGHRIDGGFTVVTGDPVALPSTRRSSRLANAELAPERGRDPVDGYNSDVYDGLLMEIDFFWSV